jgi:hypothetical protein
MTSPTPRTFMLRVGIKRKYGDHEISFEIAEQVDCNGGKERREAFLNLQAQLEDQIQVYETVSLPHVQLPQRGQSSGSATGSADTFVLKDIVVESKSGKKFVSARGGRWEKFGVPIYKECASDLIWDELPYGVHSFEHLNLTVTVELEDNKAKRCRSIR